MKSSISRESRSLVLGMLAIAAIAWASPAKSEPQLPDGFVDELIVDGFRLSPTMAFLPDNRLLVTEQWRHWIRLVVNGAQAPVDPVGVVDSVRNSSEQGLFGIAVDPRWPVKPYLYVQYSYSGAPVIRISRYAVTGDIDFTGDGNLVLDPASRFLVIADLPDSVGNHNGGILRFGADGMLYSSVGDDNSPCGAQSKQLLRGKILRLRVQDLPDGPGGPPPYADITPPDNPFVGHADPRARLVWAHGLRNPYSYHLDAQTGWMVIGDVGAGGEEEVDLAEAPGLNFGWPMYEGFTPHIACANADTGSARPVFPLYTYLRSDTAIGVAVISGGIYRPVAGGSSSFPPEHDGNIFFSDVYEGFLRRLVLDGSQWRLADSVPGQPSATDWGRGYAGATDYLVGPDGALWYCLYGRPIPGVGYGLGEIRRIRWAPPVSVPVQGIPGARLEPPAPSPARGPVRLGWSLKEDADVALDIYDLSGARVRRVAGPAIFTAGRHARTWDLADDRGRACPPGLYFVRLAVRGEEASSRRIAVIR